MMFWKRKEAPPAEEQPSKEQLIQEAHQKIASLTEVKDQILAYAGTPDWGGIADRNRLADIERRLKDVEAELKSLTGSEAETSSESEEDAQKAA